MNSESYEANLRHLIRKHPHGVVFAKEQPVGRLAKVVRHKDHKVHLDHDVITAEVARLATRAADPAYPLRLIGMRERRSENSWMHNAPALAGGRPKHAARMHPKDAAPLGLADGDLIRLTSKSGSIELPVLLTDDLRAGVVAVPHGWGHKGTGGWRTANHAGGANVNRLMSSAPENLEKLAGMAHLTGVPVRVDAVKPAAPLVR